MGTHHQLNIHIEPYEEFPVSVTDGCAQFVGGDGGAPFQLQKYGEVVQKAEFWASNVLRGLQVTFTDGSQQSTGTCDGNYTSFTLGPGQTIPEVRIAEHHDKDKGLIGWFELWGFFKVGSDSSGYFRWPDTKDRILTGFYGRSGLVIDALGVSIFKKVKETKIMNFKYNQEEINKAMSVGPIIHRQESRFPNGGRVEQKFTFLYEKYVEETWHHDVTDVDDKCKKFGTSYTADIGLEIEGVGGAKTALGVSDEFSFSHSHTSTTGTSEVVATKQTDKWEISIPAGQSIIATVTQKELRLSLEWTADLKFDFEDGTSMVQKVSGHSNTAAVSSIEYKTEPLGPKGGA